MQRAQDHEPCAHGYPQHAPAAVENAAAAENFTPENFTPLPGYFVSATYASDCARFVREAKRLARVRSEALGHSPGTSPAF
jgi:hypothetical protein